MHKAMNRTNARTACRLAYDGQTTPAIMRACKTDRREVVDLVLRAAGFAHVEAGDTWTYQGGSGRKP